ncbi:hypothetical protein BGX29_002726 [Mortierella sp. GBA35]|nr:hypothetical protein BGX23_004813 [Mortierella sp. AD031]KAF9108202.1 hypothetical protein BGX29_002726 [Mortierella sp. GBA35]KAG0219410.1 hypothetical protein BGX33_002999 [Mortierella sp. NVP41]
MAARFLDMALDDVAKSRAANNRSPASRRGGRGAGAGSGRDSPRASPYARNNSSNNTVEDRWTHDKYDESKQRAPGGRGGNGGAATGGGSKIVVENLHYAVTLEDIKELFTTHAGPVKFAEVKYDLSGRSTGVAHIVFTEAKDAAVAIDKLHGIALDGQPMKIKYAPAPARSNNRDQDRRSAPTKDAGKRDVFSRLGSSEADIAARLGKLNPLPKTSGNAGGRGQGGSAQNSSGRNTNNSSRQPRSSKPAQPKENKKPHEKSAAELDAEMDTYMGDATTI